MPAPDEPTTLFLADGLDPAVTAAVHREALRALRSAVDRAWVDAYSDDPWPDEVLPAYGQALALARAALAGGTRTRRSDPGMGIEIDLRDDAQFAVLLALAPHTIGAEAWRGGVLVYGAGDTGRAFHVTVTPGQEAALRARLAAAGLPAEALRDQPARRSTRSGDGGAIRRLLGAVGARMNPRRPARSADSAPPA
ncbi:hypothetical protein [Kitasatospora sp. NBC_00458]|uniref:hypothetical protein n=1 Tax=Kitasatospora sp. NBC_00458 TaxID=2903568 RepID=UPI002E170D85